LGGFHGESEKGHNGAISLPMPKIETSTRLNAIKIKHFALF
jgi:hypothetical protein